MSELNDKKLKAIIDALSKTQLKARVGVLGDKNTRADSEGTNASIGAKQEFGIGVLQRSFLRVPIIDNLGKYVVKSRLINVKTFEEIAQKRTMVPFLSRLGIVGVSIVLDAFKNEGWGKWPPWKDPNYTNQTGQLLQDTQQLRNSIEWDVK